MHLFSTKSRVALRQNNNFLFAGNFWGQRQKFPAKNVINMKTVELKDGQVLQAFGSGRNAYLMDITETYTKKVIIFADSEDEANEEILTADYEMTAADYLSDSLAWEEPIDVTDNVTIIEQRVIEVPTEADKPFVWLTITGEDNARKFTEITGIGPDHDNGEDFDFHDIDLTEDPAQVMRALAEVGRGNFYFTNEEV